MCKTLAFKNFATLLVSENVNKAKSKTMLRAKLLVSNKRWMSDKLSLHRNTPVNDVNMKWSFSKENQPVIKSILAKYPP